MRGAGRLDLLHLVLAAAGVVLLVGATTMIVARQRLSVPSSQAIAEACSSWLTAGGPASLIGLAIATLTLTGAALGLRSIHRQVGADRRYLASQRPGIEPVEIEGVPCHLIDSAEPRAFCAGYLRPRIYLSRGALDQLERDELRAVLAHESHHASSRDPLRLLAARTLADSLFFIPILRRSSERYAALGELAADEAAVAANGSRGPLAAALLKFTESPTGPTTVVALSPERVDHLLGDPEVTRWRLPNSPLARSAFALAALGAASFSIWHGVLEPNLQLPFLVALACAGLMVCGPVVLAITALLFSGYALRRRRA